MNVLFLNPPFHRRYSREQRSPAVTKSGTLTYPRWLCLAAAVAEKHGHTIDVIDAPAHGTGLPEVLARIIASDAQALVCDTSTPSIHHDLNTVTEIAASLPHLHIALVGPHVSAVPKETLDECPVVEAIAVREYEHTIVDWLSALEERRSIEAVPGLVCRNQQGEIVVAPPRAPIEDLDQLPFVSDIYRRYLTLEDYFYAHSAMPIVVIDTARGCPYTCSYCSYPQVFSGHRMRYRSIPNVLAEFQFIAREMPNVKSVMIEDDTFILDVKRVRGLCEGLIREGNRLRIGVNCRPDIEIALADLQLMRRAGFRVFCVGFDSGNAAILGTTSRNRNERLNSEYIGRAKRFVQMCRKAGILVHGCFMFGHLGDTADTIAETLALSLKLNPDTAQYFPLMVYPGTLDYERAKQRGLLSTEDYTQWLTPEGLHHNVIDLPGLPHEKVLQLCYEARRTFYLRPSYIGRKLWQSLRDSDEFRRNLRGFMGLARHLWKKPRHSGEQTVA